MEGTPSAGTDADEAPRATPALASQADAPAAAISSATGPTASTATGPTAPAPTATGDALQGSRGASVGNALQGSCGVSALAALVPPRIKAKWKLEDTTELELEMQYPASGDMAEAFKVDVAFIDKHKWDPTAPLQLCMDGPERLKGKWNWSIVLQSLAPGGYTTKAHAVAAIKNTCSKKYRSRTEVWTKNVNVGLVVICIVNQLFFLICTFGDHSSNVQIKKSILKLVPRIYWY
jgi:hypothetical protein